MNRSLLIFVIFVLICLLGVQSQNLYNPGLLHIVIRHGWIHWIMAYLSDNSVWWVLTTLLDFNFVWLQEVSNKLNQILYRFNFKVESELLTFVSNIKMINFKFTTDHVILELILIKFWPQLKPFWRLIQLKLSFSTLLKSKAHQDVLDLSKILTKLIEMLTRLYFGPLQRKILNLVKLEEWLFFYKILQLQRFMDYFGQHSLYYLIRKWVQIGICMTDG